MSNDEELYVDGEMLITEVRKRPLLYDSSLSEYSDRTKRARCWDEVCEQMISNWETLSQIEKSNLNRDIQKRWRSIRDSFMKDYKKRIMQNGADATRGKRYIFYKQMMFIIPTIGKRRNNSGNSQLENVPQNTNEYDEVEEVLTEKSNERPIPKRPKKYSVEKEPKKAVLQNQQHEEDEDKMFLLSLLPLFKIMKEDIKLTARIKVLETVRQSLLTDSYLSFSPYQHQPTVSASSRQDLQTQTSAEDLDCHLQETLPVSSNNSTVCFADIDEPSSPTVQSDFKCEPESPQLIVEERDPLCSTNDSSIPRKKPRSETVVTSRLSSSTAEDVFDAIGKNVAHKLRGMTQQQRIIAEKIISDVMYHGQMETLTIDSHLSLNKNDS